MDITDTLRHIAAGNKEAFVKIVEHYQQPLFGFLGRMGLSPAIAEEIAQETFLRAWKNLAHFNPQRATFTTWLFTIARNASLTELSRLSRRQEIPAEDALREMECDRPQPPEALSLDQRRQRVQAALRKLPDADRCVVALAYIESIKLSDIAAIEQCTTGAVKTRLFRARKKLHTLLKNDDA